VLIRDLPQMVLRWHHSARPSRLVIACMDIADFENVFDRVSELTLNGTFMRLDFVTNARMFVSCHYSSAGE